MITHFGVIYFSGDLTGTHPDPELNGCSPSMEIIAAGGEDFCWEALSKWTAKHPLRMGENAEVLARTSHPEMEDV